jgi:hypothetical protein
MQNVTYDFEWGLLAHRRAAKNGYQADQGMHKMNKQNKLYFFITTIKQINVFLILKGMAYIKPGAWLTQMRYLRAKMDG